MTEVLQEPDVRARFQAAYLTPTGDDGKRLGEIVAAGYKSWGPIIKSSNFQASK
jgi:tripartite-type tricarboxylate transporter receptor subunit TctC